MSALGQKQTLRGQQRTFQFVRLADQEASRRMGSCPFLA
jgi:hypothetical protein